MVQVQFFCCLSVVAFSLLFYCSFGECVTDVIAYQMVSNIMILRQAIIAVGYIKILMQSNLLENL